MICWRCGTEINDRDITCPNCGAVRPKTRRKQASAGENGGRGEDAGHMSAQIEDASDVADVAQDGAPVGRRSSRRPTAPERPRRAGRSRPMEPADPAVQPAGEAAYDEYGDSYDNMELAFAGSTGASTPVDIQQDVPRMVRRHAYRAILPETRGYDHVNWLRMCIIAVLSVVVLVAGVYFFLSKTMPGQRLLAANGREASVEAYHEVGRMFMADGSISRAIWALEIAQSKDPDNLEILIDLGKAYMGNNDRENAELAYTRAIQYWPAYPEPYRLLANNMLEQERNFEALQLVEMAIEETEDSFFDTMHTRLIPSLPAVLPLGGRFEKEIEELTLTTTDEGGIIYYTLDDTDPSIEGIEYDGKPLYLEEGFWKLRAVVAKGGMFSKEQVQTYSVIKPSPDMPKANLARGTYKTVRTVSLRGGGKDPVEIYYTIDGTAPANGDEISVTAKLFEEPITLRVGKTNLRAVAVNTDGKISNELVLEYKCEGRTMASMTEKDVIDKLKLFSTTRETFETTYGAPSEEIDDGEDLLGTYKKLIYPFGHATFLYRGGDKEPVLVELSTKSNQFTLSRDVNIGSRLDAVVDAFRDEGGEESANGDRVLYTLTDGRIALLTKIAENEYTASYYCKQANGQFIELTFHATDGLVDRIDWMQY